MLAQTISNPMKMSILILKTVIPNAMAKKSHMNREKKFRGKLFIYAKNENVSIKRERMQARSL